MVERNEIRVEGAREHNLKSINITIPRNEFTVITGLSGSGKSSLAFDTIYAEGQRRYVESLSAYARQFLDVMHKPDVDHISGLSPAISIEQKTTSKNPRAVTLIGPGGVQRRKRMQDDNQREDRSRYSSVEHCAGTRCDAWETLHHFPKN